MEDAFKIGRLMLPHGMEAKCHLLETVGSAARGHAFSLTPAPAFVDGQCTKIGMTLPSSACEEIQKHAKTGIWQTMPHG